MNSADAEPRPDIQVIAGGPLRVNGPLPLEDAQGGPIETRAAYSLCRCGQSSNKPFCDGNHKGAGFTGEETADKGGIRDRWKVYKGESITIYDDRSVCSHAGVCTDDLPHCYRPGHEPWIVPDAEQTVEKQIDIVRRCPSGAISYSLGDSDEIVEEEKDPGVTLTRDGPLAVVGRVELKSAEGASYETRARVALCRCGGSKNKPYCDGTHWHIGFKDG